MVGWDSRREEAIQENPVFSRASAALKNSSKLVIRHESLYKEMRRSNNISFLEKDSFFLLYDLLSGSTQSCIKVNPQLCVGGEIKYGHFAFLLFSLSCRDLRGPKCTNRERKKAHHRHPPVGRPERRGLIVSKLCSVAFRSPLQLSPPERLLCPLRRPGERWQDILSCERWEGGERARE